MNKGIHIANLYHVFIKHEFDNILTLLGKVQSVHPGWTKAQLEKLRAVFNKLPKLNEGETARMQECIDIPVITYAINMIRRDLGHHQQADDAIPPNELKLAKDIPKLLEKLCSNGQLLISKPLSQMSTATQKDERAQAYWIPPLSKT